LLNFKPRRIVCQQIVRLCGAPAMVSTSVFLSKWIWELGFSVR
jgi:hypothetical protein